MSKKRLKAQNPNRNRKYKMLRSYDNNIVEYIDKRGNTINLNINKRLLFNRPYKNQEYNKELQRHAKDLMDNVQGDNNG